MNGKVLYKCLDDPDEYVYAVYQRVLVMLIVLYKWKLNKISNYDLPIHKKYYIKAIDKLNNIYENISQQKCDDLEFNLYEDVIDEPELMNSSSKIQMVLLMNFKYIVAQSFSKSERLMLYIKTCLMINKLLGYKFVIGYDLYGPERWYKDKVYKKNVIDINKNFDLNYFAHAGEILDDNIGKYNIEFSLANNVKRIGHGFYLLKHPIDEKVYIEVCPYSNHILGYYNIADHPAKLQLNNPNVVISISSDDPSAFGYEYLTYDYYLICKYWKLSIADLHNLILNGIYSARHGRGISSYLCKIYVKLFQKWFDEWQNNDSIISHT
jgi:hypothetical protein